MLQAEYTGTRQHMMQKHKLTFVTTKVIENRTVQIRVTRDQNYWMTTLEQKTGFFRGITLWDEYRGSHTKI